MKFFDDCKEQKFVEHVLLSLRIIYARIHRENMKEKSERETKIKYLFSMALDFGDAYLYYCIISLQPSTFIIHV